MKGISLRRVPAGVPGAGIAVVRVHYSADPTMTPERVDKYRTLYTSPARWRREMEIEYEALEGTLFYPEFNESLNVCEPFDVSDRSRWTIWMAGDPHMRTPHAFAWEAYSDDGEEVQCGELWPEKAVTTKSYAAIIEWLESDSDDKPANWAWANGKKLHVWQRYMDTHGSAANSDEGTDYFEAYRNHGLDFTPAKKGSAALESARDAIGAALLPRTFYVGEIEYQLPKHRIFSTCPETINEFKNVRYPEGDAERHADERPMTYRKHCMDCKHYIRTAQPGFMMPVRRGDEFKPIYPSIGY